MNALLVAQRAALKRASLEHTSAAAPLPTAAAQHAAFAHGGATSDVATTSDDEGAQARVQAAAAAAASAAQQQWHYQHAAALAAQHPLPNTLSSPSCTFQHQQVFTQQRAAGYAVA